MGFRPIQVDAYLVLGDAEDFFECELRALTVTPNPDWINTLCPAGSWPDVTWTLDLTYLPGTQTADPDTGTIPITLDDYLYQHYGEQADFVAWPYGQTQPGYVGLCSLAPGSIGGPQAEWPELGVSLPIYGQPDTVVANTSTPVALQQLRTFSKRRVALSSRTDRHRSLVRW